MSEKKEVTALKGPNKDKLVDILHISENRITVKDWGKL